MADISETAQEYLIKAQLPEVRKEDVKITLDNGVITIAGERRMEKELKEANEIRVESFYGTFSRSFALPDNIDAGAIKAEQKDGVLKVRISEDAGSGAEKDCRGDQMTYCGIEAVLDAASAPRHGCDALIVKSPDFDVHDARRQWQHKPNHCTRNAQPRAIARIDHERNYCAGGA